MKRTVQVGKLSIPLWSGLAAVLLCTVVHTSAMINPAITRPAAFSDSIYVQKKFTSSKYRVRLYPNANHQVLFFSASGSEGKAYQFFLFDMEGKLVRRANIRNKETTVLNNIEKGIYLFEVFSNDERIENGQLFVR